MISIISKNLGIDFWAFSRKRKKALFVAFESAKMENSKIILLGGSRYEKNQALFYNLFFYQKPRITWLENDNDFGLIRIFVFHNEHDLQKSTLTTDDLKEVSHVKIGRVLEFPDFAIEDFMKNLKSRLKIEIAKKGMFFIVENSESRKKDVADWASEQGLKRKDITFKVL